MDVFGQWFSQVVLSCNLASFAVHHRFLSLGQRHWTETLDKTSTFNMWSSQPSVMTEVMTFSCQCLYARISRLSVRAWSGLRKQPTLQSHFYFTSQLFTTSHNCTTGRGIYTHTNTCSPARVQHAYNDKDYITQSYITQLTHNGEYTTGIIEMATFAYTAFTFTLHDDNWSIQ